MKMAGVTGLEPAASCVTGMRSNQLSYTRQFRDRSVSFNELIPEYCQRLKSAFPKNNAIIMILLDFFDDLSTHLPSFTPHII